MGKTTSLYLLLVLSLMSIAVSATERSYKIELIIFAQDMPNTEVFEQTESQIQWPRRVSSLSAYHAVGSDGRYLKSTYARLSRSHNYQPLLHVAWTQSVNSNSWGRAVRISNPEGTINGFFQIQRGHLVHLKADFEYSVGSTVYRLNEKRRFKLKETHYLDHPKFGVIARVSPIGD